MQSLCKHLIKIVYKMKKVSDTDIKQANIVLENNLKDICSVREWAQVLGFNDPVRFNRAYRNIFGEKPKSAMVRMRLGEAVRLLRECPDMSCYEVARAIGKKDEKALNYYFYTNIGQPPSSFRKK